MLECSVDFQEELVPRCLWMSVEKNYALDFINHTIKKGPREALSNFSLF